MQHAEPKVTIDLKEYNELLEKSKAVDGNEALTNAKQAICYLVINRGDIQRTRQSLQQHGLYLDISDNFGSLALIEPKHITIKKIQR